MSRIWFWLLLGAFALPYPALAATSWSQLSSGLSARCGNYCDVSGKRTADSSNGRSATGDFWWGYTNGSSPVKAMSRTRMQSYGIRNSKNLVVNYARTIAISGERALLHMGTGYPTSGGYIPVYAKRGSNGWELVGPVKVDGQVRYVFSSSMAYVYRNGVHWMVQDAGAYGYGKMVAFRSTDGINYSRVGGDIAKLTGDSGPAWPDLAYFGGRWHLVYAERWDNGNIRHLSSADMRNWRVENKTALYAYKGCNLIAGSDLRCHANGKLWRANVGTTTNDNFEDRGGDGPTGASACTAPEVSLSGTTASARWQVGSCKRKLVKDGTALSFARDYDGRHEYMGLAKGRYRFGVRIAKRGSTYSWTNFEVNGSGPPTSDKDADDPADAPAASMEACTGMMSMLSGSTANLKWNPGNCRRKLVKDGTSVDFARDYDATHSYSRLSRGSYKAGVRRGVRGAPYSWTYFRIP